MIRIFEMSSDLTYKPQINNIFTMSKEKQSELTKYVFIFIAAVMLIFGLMFISTVSSKPGDKGHIFPAFDDLSKMFYRYLIILATMSPSITIFTTAASMLRNKIARNVLSVLIAIINVFLTFTLIPAFIGLIKMAVNSTFKVPRDTAKEMSKYFLQMGKVGAIVFYVFVILIATLFIVLAIFNCILVVCQKKVVFKGGVRIVDLPKSSNDPIDKNPELFA